MRVEFEATVGYMVKCLLGVWWGPHTPSHQKLTSLELNLQRTERLGCPAILSSESKRQRRKLQKAHPWKLLQVNCSSSEPMLQAIRFNRNQNFSSPPHDPISELWGGVGSLSICCPSKENTQSLVVVINRPALSSIKGKP